MRMREVLAVVIAFACAAAGLVMMWNGESALYGDILPNTPAFNGLIKYLYGFGIIMLGASVAYILLGHEEDIATTSNDLDKK